MPRLARAVQTKPRTALASRTAARPAGPAVGPARPAVAKPRPAMTPAPGAVSPASTPMPWDSAYETNVSAARAKYNNALAALGYNRQAVQQDYGLDAGFNDYKANPYSRAALLEGTFQKANRASQTSLGEAGQLYSGALQNQLGYNRSAHDQDMNSLRSAYQNALQEIRNKELASADDLGEAIGEAGWRRVEAAEREPLDPSSVAGPGRGRKSKGRPRIGVGRARRVR